MSCLVRIWVRVVGLTFSPPVQVMQWTWRGRRAVVLCRRLCASKAATFVIGCLATAMLYTFYLDTATEAGILKAIDEFPFYAPYFQTSISLFQHSRLIFWKKGKINKPNSRKEYNKHEIKACDYSLQFPFSSRETNESRSFFNSLDL